MTHGFTCYAWRGTLLACPCRCPRTWLIRRSKLPADLPWTLYRGTGYRDRSHVHVEPGLRISRKGYIYRRVCQAATFAAVLDQLQEYVRTGLVTTDRAGDGPGAG